MCSFLQLLLFIFLLFSMHGGKVDLLLNYFIEEFTRTREGDLRINENEGLRM